MYTTPTILKRNKYAVFQIALIWVLVFCAGRVEAQRVYANAQQASTPETIIILGTVSQVQNAGLTVDADLTNYSSLSVYLGLLNLYNASQNLQFTGAVKPLATSPIMVKFRLDAGLLGLLNSSSFQRTSSEALVSTAYDASSLLSLLGLGAVDAVAMLPPQGVAYDGIRFRVGSVVGLGTTSRYYYAFIITNPTVSNTTICANNTSTLKITNKQAGYTYKWYDASNNLLKSSTDTFYTTPVLSSTTNYKVIAYEADTAKAYYSGATDITVNVNPLPTAPSFAGPIPVCKDSTKILTVTSPATNTVYRWYKTAAGGTAIFTGNAYTTSALAADTTLYVDAYNTVTTCTSTGRTAVTITVTTVPNTVATSQMICSGLAPATFTSTLPATAGSNTFQWQQSADNVLFTTALNTATGITYTAPTLTQTTYYRRVATLSGCASRSNVITVTVSALPTITYNNALYNCLGDNAVALVYTNTTGSPNQYNITWTGSPAGLPNVTNATLTGTSGNMSLQILPAATVGVHNGVLTVKNSSCTSTSYNFSLTIQAHPSVTPVATSYQ